MTRIANHRVGKPSPLVIHMGALVSQIHSELTTSADQTAMLANYTNRLQDFAAGLEKWQCHPYRRMVSEPNVVWSKGASRLLDYGSIDEASNPNGPPIVVIPSLINRAYILDLTEDNSLLRFLARSGFRPLLLDWGIFGDAENAYDFNNFVEQRLLPSVEVAKSLSNQTPALLGYCMGGTMAAGVLATSGNEFSAFATIGSPWDFSKLSGTAAKLRDLIRDPEVFLDAAGHTFGMIPADVFQFLFASIDPLQASIKFSKFGHCDQKSKAAQSFVAVEDWLNDAVSLPAPAAKNLLLDWNHKNDPATSSWRLLGEVVDLSNIDTPTLIICGKKDSIAPINVAKSLADIPDATLLTPNLGHVGMIVSSKARSEVWQPLVDFLRNNMS